MAEYNILELAERQDERFKLLCDVTRKFYRHGKVQIFSIGQRQIQGRSGELLVVNRVTAVVSTTNYGQAACQSIVTVIGDDLWSCSSHEPDVYVVDSMGDRYVGTYTWEGDEVVTAAYDAVRSIAMAVFDAIVCRLLDPRQRDIVDGMVESATDTQRELLLRVSDEALQAGGTPDWDLLPLRPLRDR